MASKKSFDDEGCFTGCGLFLIGGVILYLWYMIETAESDEAKRNMLIAVGCFIGGLLVLSLLAVLFRNRSYCVKDTHDELSKIDNMNGLDFERYVAKILRMNGFANVNLTKSSGDFGVDITARYNGKKYAFQCKRYNKNIGIKPIQEVYTGKQHYKADVAVVITNVYFSKNAVNLANETGVLLWDRDVLTKLMGNCVKATRKNHEQIRHRKRLQDNKPNRDKIVRTHVKHIPYVEGTKEYVNMFLLEENLEKKYLISEPFNTVEEAQHFSDCFNDSFAADSFVKCHNDLFYVYSDWVQNFLIRANYREDIHAFVFANWS